VRRQKRIEAVFVQRLFQPFGFHDVSVNRDPWVMGLIPCRKPSSLMCTSNVHAVFFAIASRNHTLRETSTSYRHGAKETAARPGRRLSWRDAASRTVFADRIHHYRVVALSDNLRMI
jgi:hypothetical protein